MWEFTTQKVMKRVELTVTNWAPTMFYGSNNVLHLTPYLVTSRQQGNLNLFKRLNRVLWLADTSESSNDSEMVWVLDSLELYWLIVFQ